MSSTFDTYCFSEILQDTLVRPQQSQPSITVRRPQLDLEHAEEVMRQFEQREQEIIASQQPRVVKPKPAETLRAPSIEVDALMAGYQYIGCSPRATFPDTFTLTVLERYYQPIVVVPVVVDSVNTPAIATDTTMAIRDSIQTVVPVTVVRTPAINSGFASENRPESYPSSITIFITCGLILLAIIKYHFGKNLWESFLSFFNYHRARRMYEERRESDRQASLLCNILFAWVTGIFISVALPFFGVNPLWGDYKLSILSFSLVTGLLYVLKSWIWKALGVVFMVQSFTKAYIYNMYLYNRNIGLMIFPLVAAIPYISPSAIPGLIYGVMVVVVLSYLFKVWRTFQIIHAQNVPAYYFILYLCALEILPFLLLIKGCKMLSEYVFSL